MVMVAMLCGVAAMAQGLGTLSCGDVSATAGGETTYLEVMLNTDDVTAISGIQFYFSLPDGISIAQSYNEDDEEYVDDVTFPIAKARHQVGIKETADGYMAFLGGDKSLSFKTTTNLVVRIGIIAAQDTKNGVYDINFVKAKFSDKSDPIKSYNVADFSAKLTVTGGVEPQPQPQTTCTLSAADIEAVAGGETTYMEVKVATEDITAISGIQFKFFLPEGVSIALRDEDGDMEEDVTFPIAKSNHQVGIKSTTDGGYLVYLGGVTSLSFKTTTDVVARIGLSVAKTVKDGAYDINFSNAVMSDKSDPIQSHAVADFSAKLTVTGGSTPQPQITCTLSAADIEAVAGGETTYMEVKLATEDITAISGIQFKFFLPEGVSIALRNDDGDLTDDVTFPIAKPNHQVGIGTTSDGGYLVYLGGDKSLSFKTTTDVIAKIGLTVANTVKSGTYDIPFEKVVVSDKSAPIKSYAVADFNTKLTVIAAEPDSEDTDISKLDNVIYLEKIETFVGSTATLSFKMKNTVDIRGFQFDLYLPEGVTPVKKNGRIQAKLSSSRLPEDDEHTLSTKEQSDGAIRFLCGSLYDETFTGHDGEIITLSVDVAKDMAAGNYPVIMKDVKMTETNATAYTTKHVQSTLSILPFMPGDVNGDGIVDVSDYISVANYILGIPQSVFIEGAGDVAGENGIDVSDYIGIANIIMTGNPQGNSKHVKPAYVKASVSDINTIDNVIYPVSQEVAAGMQTTLSFHMKNTAAIRGFQFDLYLPEGITVVKNAKGRIQGALANDRLPEDDEHTLTIQEQGDGAIRFLCGSLYDETFTGNEGEIITLQINVAETMKNGDYAIVLQDVKLTETNTENYYYTDTVESTIKVIGGTGIVDVLEGDNAPAIIYNLSGQRLAKPQHGINIINGKKVMLK